MQILTILSFLFFTGLVGAITYWLTRNDDHGTSKGYFLAGRSLTFPLIAGSLLLTNLSTEQLVGLNGGAFKDGLCVMVWEVFAVLALVAMALFFLPRFLKSGIATVPEFLEIRYDRQTQIITNVIFLLAYVVILLPIILYTGAMAMIDILDLETLLGLESRIQALWIIVWVVGILGSAYALFGGLRTVAVSDTLNGIGLLIGGFLIAGFALSALGGEGGLTAGLNDLYTNHRDRLNSVGAADTSVPFGAVFSGIFLLHLFYWTTNQQIIQRTLGAKSLAEGQKGVLLTGAMKLLGPFYLVLPGIIAYALMTKNGQLATETITSRTDVIYGSLVAEVLPGPLAGFFAAAMIGAILSSFNSALNSSCTIFSLGIYKNLINPKADESQVVRSGKWFGLLVAIASMSIAPLLLNTADGIFPYLQKMNGMYFIPILAVVFVGMVSTRVPALAAKIALLGGVAVIACGYFVPNCKEVVDSMGEFYFLGIVFMWLTVVMLIVGAVSPRETEWVQEDVKAVDLTPWKYAKIGAAALVLAVLTIYLVFADFSVLVPR